MLSNILCPAGRGPGPTLYIANRERGGRRRPARATPAGSRPGEEPGGLRPTRDQPGRRRRARRALRRVLRPAGVRWRRAGRARGGAGPPLQPPLPVRPARVRPPNRAGLAAGRRAGARRGRAGAGPAQPRGHAGNRSHPQAGAVGPFRGPQPRDPRDAQGDGAGGRRGGRDGLRRRRRRRGGGGPRRGGGERGPALAGSPVPLRPDESADRRLRRRPRAQAAVRERGVGRGAPVGRVLGDRRAAALLRRVGALGGDPAGGGSRPGRGAGLAGGRLRQRGGGLHLQRPRHPGRHARAAGVRARARAVGSCRPGRPARTGQRQPGRRGTGGGGDRERRL